MKTDRSNSQSDQTSDKYLWYFWMVLVVISVALLPFIVRESAVARALADMCISALGL